MKVSTESNNSEKPRYKSSHTSVKPFIYFNHSPIELRTDEHKNKIVSANQLLHPFEKKPLQHLLPLTLFDWSHPAHAGGDWILWHVWHCVWIKDQSLDNPL